MIFFTFLFTYIIQLTLTPLGPTSGTCEKRSDKLSDIDQRNDDMQNLNVQIYFKRLSTRMSTFLF